MVVTRAKLYTGMRPAVPYYVAQLVHQMGCRRDHVNVLGAVPQSVIVRNEAQLYQVAHLLPFPSMMLAISRASIRSDCSDG